MLSFLILWFLIYFNQWETQKICMRECVKKCVISTSLVILLWDDKKNGWNGIMQIWCNLIALRRQKHVALFLGKLLKRNKIWCWKCFDATNCFGWSWKLYIDAGGLWAYYMCNEVYYQYIGRIDYYIGGLWHVVGG